MRLPLRMSIQASRGKRIKLVIHWGGIFAIHSGFAGSGRECKKRRYRVDEKDGEVISS